MMTKTPAKAVVALLLASCAHPVPPSDEDRGALVRSQEIRCPGTKMIGWEPDEELTTQDRQSFERAQARCPSLYPKSPCLVGFEKRAPGNYWATCGSQKP